MSAEVAVVALACLLLVVAAFLAVAETSLSRIDRFRAQVLAEEKRRGSGALWKILEHPDRFSGYLNSVLLLLLAAQMAMASSVTYVLLRHIDGPVLAAAILVEILIVYVVAEAMPKTWAVQHTERAALFSAPIISGIARVIPMRLLSRPLIWFANVLLPGKGLPQGPFVYEQQILALADTAAKEQAIEREEHRLIHSVIEFGTTVAREVMVPRVDMVMIDKTATADQAIEIALERGFSRIPVHGPDNDEIIGTLFTKDLMRAVRDGQEYLPVSALVRPTKFVPETKRVAELLAEMQIEKTHMAIVVDEYGGLAGLVTLEDLVEEVVGEIVDEYDVEEVAQIEDMGNGCWKIDARLAIDEVFERTGIKLPHGEWDTVGGLLINAFGRVPGKGDVIEVDDYRVRVEATSGRRVGRVTVELVVAPEGDPSESEDQSEG